ncbi:hypothetical protein ElyMa_000692700 [Elysia marginata]|uniref:TNFR-Cys domain-containing protein n=1 Tax=Elysia marginata TaxID=1093978 RepID=A0AAV4GHQ7_9GAST|nr:hypothetical protein ElyMa_000692700 [Elysia marginata]
MKGLPDPVLVTFDIVKSLLLDTWEVLILVVVLTTLAQFLYGCWGRRAVCFWRSLWESNCDRNNQPICQVCCDEAGGSGEAVCPSKSRNSRRRRRRRKCEDSSSSSSSCSTCSTSCTSYCPGSCSGSCYSFQP